MCLHACIHTDLNVCTFNTHACARALHMYIRSTHIACRCAHLVCHNCMHVNAQLYSRGALTSRSLLAGTSGGSIVAAAVAAGVPIPAVLQGQREIAAYCRKHGTFGMWVHAHARVHVHCICSFIPRKPGWNFTSKLCMRWSPKFSCSWTYAHIQARLLYTLKHARLKK